MTHIVKGWPPNIEDIRAVLPVTSRNIFSWGYTIYNPSGGDLSPALIEHEKVHGDQQGGDPKSWWQKFLNSPEFRLQQEIPAHRTEYRAFCRLNKDRNARVAYLNSLGRRLAHPMYGKIITLAAAIKEIQH